ncbi:MAG: cell division protein ZipA [Oleispira sp.]|jgi:cell division protein ZipA
MHKPCIKKYYSGEKMELNLRTVLVILGGIVMLGILVDGFRRMRRSRQDALSLDVKGDFKFPEDSFPSELPNGGARVIGVRDTEEILDEAKRFRDQLNDLPVMSALESIEANAEQALDADIKSNLHENRVYAGEPDFQHQSYAHDEPEEALKQESSAVIPERVVLKAKPLNLDEHVPLLMDVEELGDDVAAHEELLMSKRVETKNAPLEMAHTDKIRTENSVTDYIELTLDDVKGIQASVSDIGELLSVEKNIVEGESSIVAKIDVPEIAEYDSRQQAQDMATKAAYAPVKKPGINAEKLINRSAPSLVLVTHVIPHDEEGFCGEDILYLVNSCDLRHGEKEIFHRFEKEQGEGYIQFSMANSFNPGTFDPETLLHERIYGVSLFMSLPGPEKAMDAFEAMTEMASVIARNLGGEVHDETHSIMALQTIEHNRQLVRDCVRKQKLAGKK